MPIYRALNLLQTAAPLGAQQQASSAAAPQLAINEPQGGAGLQTAASGNQGPDAAASSGSSTSSVSRITGSQFEQQVSCHILHAI